MNLQSIFRDVSSSILYLLVFFVITRLPVSLNEVNYVAGNSFANLILSPIFEGQILSKVVLSLLSLLNGYLLIVLLNNQKIVREKSYLQGIVYIIFSALRLHEDWYTISIVCDTILILLFFQLFDIYKKDGRITNVFSLGFWTGVLCLLDFSYIVFLPFFFIGMLIMRKGYIRDILVLLLSFFFPFYLYWLYLFYMDRGADLVPLIIESFHYIKTLRLTSVKVIIHIVLLVLASGYAIMNTSKFNRKTITKTKNFISTFIWCLLFCWISSLLLNENISSIGLAKMTLPISVLFTLSLLEIKKPLFQWIVFSIPIGIIYVMYFLVV